ncbi:MAG: hypothetical protein ACE5HE_08785 [Phycisphaerae bacterium]
MATGAGQILETAREGFATQDTELATARERQRVSVITKTATGTGDILEAVALDRRFRLVFIRCHFSGTSGTAPFAITVDSTNGPTYDALLYTINKAGAGRDVNFRVSAPESTEPSPWTFQAGDGVGIQWTNPDPGNITWGLEVGLAIAM